MRRFVFSLPVGLVCVALTLLTLPSVPENVAAWAGWLAWVDASFWRYALPIAGWVGLGFLFAVRLYLGHRRSVPDPGPALPVANNEPRNRAELRSWLEVRIEEIVAWRAAIDEEVAKPVPNIDRTQSIESMFWGGLNRDVSRKLQLLAPEWTEYWGEEPEWFYSGLTRITSEQVAEFGRLLGWVAERLRHIKSELPSPP